MADTQTKPAATTQKAKSAKKQSPKKKVEKAEKAKEVKVVKEVKEKPVAQIQPTKGGDGEKVRKRVSRPRNYDLGNGVWRFSRPRMYKKRAIYLFTKKHKEEAAKKGEKDKKDVKKEDVKKAQTIRKKKPKKPLYVKKEIGGEKNGGHRLVRVKKLPSYYPTAPKLKKKPTRKINFARHKRNLRRSIKPGQLLIIVAGKHRGKRVVFLKQLKTGLLLVTGPYKLNKCPLRRINQIYVIATKTRLDIKDVKVPDHLNDLYFKRKRPHRSKKDEGEIFETKKESYHVSEERKADQIEVDKQILEVIRKHPDRKYMFGYLGSRFSLRNHMYPHKMKF